MKNNKSFAIAIVALFVAVIALAMCIMCCSKKESANIEEALMAKPEIIFNAMQKYEQNMRDEAMVATQKIVQDNIDAINNNPSSPVMGNPNGKIVLVEFFDFSCGYCHKLYPAIKEVIKNNPDLKVVTKVLAFVSPVSDYAGRASLAAKEQGKYLEMYNALFSANDRLTETKVDEIAVKVGLDLERMKADMNSAKIDAQMKDNSDLAQRIQVSGVPTMVLNGKILQAIDAGVIQEAINAAK